MRKVTSGTDRPMTELKRILDRNAAREKVMARNLANSTTEGYEPKKVKFPDEFSRTPSKIELSKTNPHHIGPARYRPVSRGFVEVVDKETVAHDETKLERWVTELADAEMAYATAARLMSKCVATLRTAITGKP